MDMVQRTAVAVLQQVLDGRNMNQVLSNIMQAGPVFTAQQQGAIQDISYGTLRHYGQLSAILGRLLSKPAKDAQIRFLLIVAMYQLIYTRAAQHAVVDFAVKTAKQINPAASGLVNAVLRNLLRKRNELLNPANMTPEEKWSCQSWWYNNIKTQYPEQFEDILKAENSHPPMTLRVNCRNKTVEEYLDLLQQNQLKAAIIEPGAIMLEQPVPVGKLPGFADGWVSVQDAGAQFAAKLLDVDDGMRVLDACAAPGGKTMHIMEMADVEVLALDVDEQRLGRIRENAARLGLSPSIKQGDAAETAAWWDGVPFDRILADVPCSASGVVKRHPDIKWLRRVEDIAGFAVKQKQILESLWPLLKPGGKLLYATCSIFTEENSQVLKDFLGKHSDAIQIPIHISDMIEGQLLPAAEHDGFFYGIIGKKPT